MDKDLSSGRRDLFKMKVEAMKNLILNNKPVPENWIFKRDYNDILEKAMTNPIVLQYAIINADHHRNNAYPDYSMKKSQTLPRKSFTLSKPQLYYNQRGRNLPLAHRYKIKANRSEHNYAHTASNNENSNSLHNYQIETSGVTKDNDFLLTSIVERDLELPPIAI